MEYIIYKIVDNTNGDVYFGRIKKKLFNRMSGHRQDAKENKNISSQSIILNGDYSVEVVEYTNDKSRERYYIENFNCVNKNIPQRTIKEWRNDNRDKWRKMDRENKVKYRNWQRSWGGDLRCNNNCLLRIDINLFS